MPTDEVETDLLIRRAGPDDAVEVADLYTAARVAAVPQMPPATHTNAEDRAWMAGQIGGDDVEVWVAERGGRIAAYALITPTWLNHLFVHPDHLGTGIGTVLLDLVKSLRPGGFALWVFESNEGARRFYRRHGLTELERTDGSGNEERSPDVRMAWPGNDPIGFLRAQVDEVDDELALLLARRFALTATIQGFKTPPGQEGRDPAREQEIARRMAAHAPGLGAERIGRIMRTVIDASLEAYESGSEEGTADGPEAFS